MKKEIEEYIATRPEWQVSPGRYVDKIGNKYVYILDCWHHTTIEKVPIEDFYQEYVAKEDNMK